MTPEPALPSPNFRIAPEGGCLAIKYDLTCNRPNTRRIVIESGTLQLRSRDLTIRPRRPTCISKIVQYCKIYAIFYNTAQYRVIYYGKIFYNIPKHVVLPL
ncbi:hypothetical protein AVEN_86686-1 [Araneus ventricosus]|uniref:Uncharacterized protein n=1 Tax=Araneus ventricosus TaxID=182803 RepID=A0A4Y2RWJ7_ARAVE|nr:hypothetical protein AVEN_86686-1 [Araneus ventricosus]